MSNAIFPVLPGLGWSMTKSPQWSTKVQKAASGKEYRSAFFTQPIYFIGLSYEVLRAATSYQELQTLIAFFNARQGSYDSFLYTDPTDNAVTAQLFGSGNSVQTKFQLMRTYGGNNEAVMNLNSAPLIYINGALKALTTDYTIDAYGLVTFVTAPASALAVTWTGTYYYRCRFSKDSADFDNFMYQLWTLKKLELTGCLGYKI